MAPDPGDPRQRPSGVVIAALFGFPIGVLSGFTGVGGGEYRAPVLLALMRAIRWSIAANLLVGAVVSATNSVYRQAWTLPRDELVLVGLLVATSLPGGYVGAIVTRRTSTKGLKAFLAGILVVTGLRLILVEPQDSGGFALDASSVGIALVLGFGLGAISGLLGLAAGEYRIPALILLFGVSPVLAGTMSSLAAVPQQVVAFLKHRTLGHVSAPTYRLGVVMAASSVVGVLLGVTLLDRTTEALVAQVLGIAMIVASGGIVWDIRRPEDQTERDVEPASTRDVTP